MPNEQELDNRLNHQKEFYENMPHVSSVESIVDYIETKGKEKRRKANFLRKVPYVAGVAVVLLISVVMVSSFVMEMGEYSSRSNEGLSGGSQESKMMYAKDDSFVPENPESIPETEDAAPGTLQIVPPNNLSFSQALDQLKKMESNQISQSVMDQFFLKVLSNQKENLAVYKENWREQFAPFLSDKVKNHLERVLGDIE